ncbi:MAG: hypothetical protein J1E63_10065, partial [Muribaculaceae bacterium]|nr:hypothetical protein [Muribaculaceae bacterium]
MEEYKITLMDGREIDGILKSEQPKEVKSDEIKLDTTGQYLTFGKRKPRIPAEEIVRRAERQYYHHLFTENARFLLANAERIFSDSRMFLAPVRVQNGLAYIGTSGFWRPTIGVYLEWWLNHQEAAVDKNGNLVWYISGSPLSGRNCCSSVNPEGKQVEIALQTKFSAVWRSFIDVNNRYTEAKQRCEAYTLEEVLVMLHGEDYKCRIVELKHEMIEMVMDWERKDLQSTYNNLLNKTHKLILNNRKIILGHHREEIMEFYKGYAVREEEIKVLEKAYVTSHNELKKQLRDGTLQGDYHVLLAEAAREYKTRKRVQSDL